MADTPKYDSQSQGPTFTIRLTNTDNYDNKVEPYLSVSIDGSEFVSMARIIDAYERASDRFGGVK